MHADRKNVNWEPEHIEFIRQQYIGRKSTIEIVDGLQNTFGISPSEKAIQSVLYRHCRAEIDAKHELETKGRDALRDEARKLIMAGMSSADVARTLGVDASRIYVWVQKWQRPAQKSHWDFKRWLSRQEVETVADDPIVDGGSLITDLGEGECRWPIGRDGDGLFRFCGCSFYHGSSRLSPYCDDHMGLALQSKRGIYKVTIVVDDESNGPVVVNFNPSPATASEEKIAA